MIHAKSDVLGCGSSLIEMCLPSSGPSTLLFRPNSNFGGFTTLLHERKQIRALAISECQMLESVLELLKVVRSTRHKELRTFFSDEIQNSFETFRGHQAPAMAMVVIVAALGGGQLRQF